MAHIAMHFDTCTNNVLISIADDHPGSHADTGGRPEAAGHHQVPRLHGRGDLAAPEEVSCARPPAHSPLPTAARHAFALPGTQHSMRSPDSTLRMLAHGVMWGQTVLPAAAQALKATLECRLANHLADDVGKLGFRGTICNNEAKWEHAKVGHAPPIWFVFSGEHLAVPFASSSFKG